MSIKEKKDIPTVLAVTSYTVCIWSVIKYTKHDDEAYDRSSKLDKPDKVLRGGQISTKQSTLISKAVANTFEV